MTIVQVAKSVQCFLLELPQHVFKKLILIIFLILFYLGRLASAFTGLCVLSPSGHTVMAWIAPDGSGRHILHNLKRLAAILSSHPGLIQCSGSAYRRPNALEPWAKYKLAHNM
jgi:hypothetical protein